MKRIASKPHLADMIRKGLKTETRRIMNPQPQTRIVKGAEEWWTGFMGWFPKEEALQERFLKSHIPAYAPGEVIGLAEPWFADHSLDTYSGNQLVEMGITHADIHYLADGPRPERFGRFRQARFLPDAFVKTRIEIISTRAERLNEISEADAMAEGIKRVRHDGLGLDIGYEWSREEGSEKTAVAAYRKLWESINGPGSWDSNPYVWSYTFKLVLPC